MPSLTREEAKTLGRRAQQPVKAPGDLVAVWVSGKLVNPLNASAWGWQKRSRTAKAWKERTALALLESPNHGGHMARTPKRVTFLAHVHNRFDSDGLQAALKPVRDALVECGVISGDADRDGHLFEYTQVIDRARRGVEIRISLRRPA